MNGLIQDRKGDELQGWIFKLPKEGQKGHAPQETGGDPTPHVRLAFSTR